MCMLPKIEPEPGLVTSLLVTDLGDKNITYHCYNIRKDIYPASNISL